MKVALCCIGRLENKYAVEYVEYYNSLGFNKIFIYDNNHDDEEHFEEVLQKYINDGFIDIVNYRNKSVCQLSAYQDCYDKYRGEYDWIAFFDFDEYLTFSNNEESISDFLSQDKFKTFDAIHINWMVYGDNDLIYYENKPLTERFKNPKLPLDFKHTYNFPENYHIKTIIRGNINGIKWDKTPHTPNGLYKCCDANGNECNSLSPFNVYNFDVAWLRHYQTKTIEEYRDLKVKRGYPDGNKDFFIKKNWEDEFFSYNEKTEEKLKFINLKSNDVNIFICTHKKFDSYVSDYHYKIVWSNKINYDLTNNGLSDKFYSELYQFKYVADNVELPKYIGFCHYRRYFEFLDDIPDLDSIFSECDAIVAKPIKLGDSIKQQYARAHNIEDLFIVGGIIADKYPSYCNAWHNFINSNILIPYNMFIMKKEDFKEYINFIFSILDEYLNIVGININKRIYDNYEKYIKDFYPNNTVEYQYRIGGYLSERITNIFMMHKFKKIKTYPVIVTENKYQNEKSISNL